jgi:hypothetical protein
MKTDSECFSLRALPLSSLKDFKRVAVVTAGTIFVDECDA